MQVIAMTRVALLDGVYLVPSTITLLNLPHIFRIRNNVL
jgi:hypothetical protein